MERRFGEPGVTVGPEFIETARNLMGNAGLIKDSNIPWFGLMFGSFALAGIAAAKAYHISRSERRARRDLDDSPKIGKRR